MPRFLAYCSGPPRKGAKPAPKITPASTRSASSTTCSRSTATASFTSARSNDPADPAAARVSPGIGLLRLAFLPSIEASRRSSCRASFARPAARASSALRLALEKHFADTHDHIESDDIGKLDRTHRHAEILRRSIDQRERDTFFDSAHRFAEIRHQHAIDEKSGRALARNRKLVDLSRERERALHTLRIGELATE